MSRLYVEELTRENQAEVQALILAGMAEHWGAVEPGLNPDLEDMVSAYPDGRTLLVRRSDDDGRLVGTGTIVRRGDRSAEIVRMSVSTEARRLGIGRRIVDELVATARRWGCDRVVLETTSSWTEVVEFYRRCGFVITHTSDDGFGENTWFEYRLNSRPTGSGD